MSVRFSLICGFVLLALALGATLSRSEQQVVGASTKADEHQVLAAGGRLRICQSDEAIPKGTSALHIWLLAYSLGPSLTVQVFAGGRVISEGKKRAGWRANVTVPIDRLQHAVEHARICVLTGLHSEALQALGEPVARGRGASVNDTPIPGRIGIQYLASVEGSWWSLALPVARRMGLGHAFHGGWIVLVLAAMMLTAVCLMAWVLLRELGADGGGGRALRGARWGPLRRVPAAALVCFAIATLNGACWSVITPLFQTDDEQDHFAYVQQIAETGHLPKPLPNTPYSDEEEMALYDLRFEPIRHNVEKRPVVSLAQEQSLQQALASHPSRRGSGDAGLAGDEPPLYYAVEAVPYLVGSSQTILARMELMRLLGALMGGLTALFVYLFLREALPGTPWAWTVGGLSGAFAPLLGYVSGAINPDAMLAPVSAIGFYLLIRGFRRGLTLRLALAFGMVMAVGFLTKVNFIGIAPGLILGLLVLARRELRRSLGAGGSRLAVALAIGFSPVIIYTALNLLAGRAGLGVISSAFDITRNHGTLTQELGYIWERYLPRLPGMTTYFPGAFPLRDVWFNGFIAYYGWEDVVFSDWVNTLALIPAGLIAALCIRGVIARRHALRARAGEVIVYLTMGAGMLALVGADAYLEYPNIVFGYRSPRYLLPMLAFACLVPALAVRGAGRRWGPLAGTLIVFAFLAHDLFSQLLMISNYYG